MSNGNALDSNGSVVITNVENAGFALPRDGDLQTLLQVEDVDRADSVSVAPNGDIWGTDGRLTDLLRPFG